MGKTREDAWEKAAACEVQAQRAQDPDVKAKFRALRDSWIRVANDALFETDVAANVERLEAEQNSREKGE